jgi:hypothetical protein
MPTERDREEQGSGIDPMSATLDKIRYELDEVRREHGERIKQLEQQSAERAVMERRCLYLVLVIAFGSVVVGFLRFYIHR